MILSLHKQPFVTAHFQFITAHFVRHCALKNALGYGMEGMKKRGRRKVRGIEDGRNGK